MSSSEDFRKLMKSDDYVELPYNELLEMKNYRHAAHCLIYAFAPNSRVFKIYPVKATVLMQARFDGSIGFPGGLIDEGTDILKGINRELREEINLDSDTYCITDENHIISHVCHSHTLCVHFYALQVTLDQFQDIERRALDARDYGSETMGLLRVPLYTMNKSRGLPMFLKNQFAGNARDQLLYTLAYLNILDLDYLLDVIGISNDQI